MYSGTDGREFEADIFFGVVYYQRLRHMVADKYQVIKKPSTCDSHCTCSWSRFVSSGFAPVNDDIMLCVSSDWLLQLCHVVSASVLLVAIHRHLLFSSQPDKNLCLTLVSDSKLPQPPQQTNGHFICPRQKPEIAFACT